MKAAWTGLWLAAGAIAGGCADPCEDLQRLCDGCRDPNHKTSCETVVVAASNESCSQGLDSFKNVCK